MDFFLKEFIKRVLEERFVWTKKSPLEYIGTTYLNHILNMLIACMKRVCIEIFINTS
jgi:hypothetical protein